MSVHLAGGQQKYLLQSVMPQLNVPPIVAAVKAAASSAKKELPSPLFFCLNPDECIFALPLDVSLRLFYTAICAKRFALYDRTMVKNHG